MDDRIKCPKCNQLALVDTKYSIIRDQLIRFTGKCLNCGYEVTPEEVFDELKTKFDLEKDFEHLERPLEYILDRVRNTDEEPRKQILQILVKVYEEKIRHDKSDKNFEEVFNKIVKFEQALQGRTLTTGELLYKKGLYLLPDEKGIEYLEEAFKQEDSNKKEIAEKLVGLYEQHGQFEKAIKFLDLGHQYREKPPEIPQCAEDLYNNLYLQNKGELLLKKGSYQDALKSLEQIKYTKEIMEYVRVTFTIERDKGEISKILEDSISPLNLEAKKLSFCAAYKAGELDIAKSILYEINEVDEEKKFGVEDPLSSAENDYYFLCLIQYLSATDIAKAYNVIKGAVWAEDNEGSIYNLFEIYLSFLKGKVFLDYAVSCSDTDLMKDAQAHFKRVINGAESSLVLIFDNPDLFPVPDSVGRRMFERPLKDWVSFFGKVEKIVPQAHQYMGYVYEALHDIGNALYEYKRAEELNQKVGNPKDAKIENKIMEFSLRMKGLHEKEWDRNLEELRKLTRELKKPQSEEAYQNIVQGINKFLVFAKEKLPQIVEDIEDVKGDIEEKKRPFRILPTFRDILEGALFSIYKVRTSDYDRFVLLTDDLEKNGHITPYVRSILNFIWFSCSPAAHSQVSPRVKDLKWEDAELIISAMLRFLSWSGEK